MELEKEVHALVLEIVFTTAQLDELQEIYRDVEARQGMIRKLQLEMGDPLPHGFSLRPDLLPMEKFESQHIDWNRIFRACPRLSHLDLFDVPLNYVYLDKILDAASRYCLNLEGLAMPCGQFYDDDVEGNSDEYDSDDDIIAQRSFGALPITSKLCEALDRWRTKVDKGGLIQLLVPKRQCDASRDEVSLVRCSNEFITAVSRFCPNIKYLDGRKHSYTDDNRLKCDEMWLCSLGVWKEFCTSCTKIHEFN